MDIINIFIVIGTTSISGILSFVVSIFIKWNWNNPKIKKISHILSMPYSDDILPPEKIVIFIKEIMNSKLEKGSTIRSRPSVDEFFKLNSINERINVRNSYSYETKYNDDGTDGINMNVRIIIENMRGILRIIILDPKIKIKKRIKRITAVSGLDWNKLNAK